MPNTILKRWNGSSFEELYPKTTVGQISASGTPSSTTFLRGDGQWQIPATQSHSHGNISNAGGWNNSPITPTNADTIPLTRSGLISNSNLTIGTSTTTFLRNDGTWQTPINDAGWNYIKLSSTTARQNTTWTTILTTSTLDANSYYEIEFTFLYYKTTTAASASVQHGFIVNNTTGTPLLDLVGIFALSTYNVITRTISTTALSTFSVSGLTSGYNRTAIGKGILYTGTSTKTFSLQDRATATLTAGEFVGTSANSFIKWRKL